MILKYAYFFLILAMKRKSANCPFNAKSVANDCNNWENFPLKFNLNKLNWPQASFRESLHSHTWGRWGRRDGRHCHKLSLVFIYGRKFLGSANFTFLGVVTNTHNLPSKWVHISFQYIDFKIYFGIFSPFHFLNHFINMFFYDKTLMLINC